MAKTKIISTAEIKKIIGSSASNDIVDFWNETATEQLCDALGVYDLGVHSVVEERARAIDNGLILELRDFPVNLTGITFKDADNVASMTPPASYVLDPTYIRHLRAEDSNGYQYTFPQNQDLLVNYSAGYQVKDTLVLTALPTAGQTITGRVALTSSTYQFVSGTPTGNQIKIENTLALTVANILAVYSGTSVEAPAGTFTLTFDLGTSITSKTIAGTLTNSNVPQELKTAVAYIVGGGLAQAEKLGAVQSYTIGQKSVNFADSNEARFVQQTIAKYSFYNRVKILA